MSSALSGMVNQTEGYLLSRQAPSRLGNDHPSIGCRHATGPLHTSDLVGLDVRLGIAEYLRETVGSGSHHHRSFVTRSPQENWVGKLGADSSSIPAEVEARPAGVQLVRTDTFLSTSCYEQRAPSPSSPKARIFL